MMNRMVNKEFAQEIAAVIRTAQNGDRLPELLKHYHQRDVAKAVTLLTDAERERLFRQLDARTLAEIFPYLDDASRFLAELPADLAAAVITDMDTADALDMLRELPAEKKQALAAHLDDDTRKDVRRLLAFHQEEIGSRMSGNFVCIPDTLTVCGAMNELVRQAGEHDNISTLYVVDGSGVFAGAIDLKDLIIARENDPLSGIIRRSYPYVLAHEKVEDCIDRIAEYEEDSLPVLTEDGRIAGILTAQDLVELVDDAMGDDYAKLGGLTSEEDLQEPAAVSMKKRLPWLIVLLFLGMGVSSVVGIFESVVAVPVAGAGYGGQRRHPVAGRHHSCPHGREPYPEGGAGPAGQGDAGRSSQRRVPGTHGAGGFRGLHPCVQGLCVGAGFSDLRLRWGVAGGGHGDLQPCGDDGSHAVS